MRVDGYAHFYWMSTVKGWWLIQVTSWPTRIGDKITEGTYIRYKANGTTSRGILTMADIDRERLVGVKMPVKDGFYKAMSAEVQCARRQAIETGKPVVMSVQMSTPGGCRL